MCQVVFKTLSPISYGAFQGEDPGHLVEKSPLFIVLQLVNSVLNVNIRLGGSFWLTLPCSADRSLEEGVAREILSEINFHFNGFLSVDLKYIFLRS